MIDSRIPVSSTTTVYSVIEADVADPTGSAVSFAFTSTPDGPGTTWLAGTWETVAGQFRAKRLITAGDLAVGVWYVWVKVAASPAMPVMLAGQIEVF